MCRTPTSRWERPDSPRMAVSSSDAMWKTLGTASPCAPSAGSLATSWLGEGGHLVAFCCVDAMGETIMPCGRCRQLLWEHGGPTMLIDTPAGVQTMTEVLPQAFGVDNLDRVANQQEKS